MIKTSRTELKYIISYKDYIKIIEPIKSLLSPDENGVNGKYEITSIYLDDIFHTAAMDKAFGNRLHQKYRIRYYDNPKLAKLELKEKEVDQTTKYTMPINESVYNAILQLDTDTLYNYFEDKLIRKFTLDFNRKHLEPKCYIRYKREAYTDGSDNFRLTFDQELETTYFDTDSQGEYIKFIKDSEMILELKYTHYVPKPVKEILNQIKLDKIAYSKYFMGYQQLTL